MSAVSVPAALVFGASALVGGASIGIAVLDHVRATQAGERMQKVGLQGARDYFVLAGAIFATVLSVPSAISYWTEAFEELR